MLVSSYILQNVHCVAMVISYTTYLKNHLWFELILIRHNLPN